MSLKPMDEAKNYKLFERFSEKELPIDWTGKRGYSSLYIFSDPMLYAVPYKNEEEWRDVMERTDFLKCRQKLFTDSQIFKVTKYFLESEGFVLDLYFDEKLSEEEEHKKYEILQKFYVLGEREYPKQYEPIQELIKELDQKNKFLTGIKLGKGFGEITINSNGTIKIKVVGARTAYDHELEWLEEALKGTSII